MIPMASGRSLRKWFDGLLLRVIWPKVVVWLDAQYRLTDAAWRAEYDLYSAGIDGHMDRVKQVCRMMETDLRAEIETQRDRITVLNKRVQELERLVQE